MAEKDRQSNSQEQQSERKFSQEQYDILKRCSDRKDMTEWNNWREKHPDKDVLLSGANLIQFYLRGAFLNKAITIDNSGRIYDFNRVIEEPNVAYFSQKSENIGDIYLDGTKLRRADLEGALFYDANLKAADVSNAKLAAAEFWRSEMQDTNFGRSTVDGSTMFWKCKFNRDTDFSGVGL